jgi:hypothetical protein
VALGPQAPVVTTQAPLTQALPVAHFVPQAPQLFGSLELLVHVPAQFSWPDWQEVTHAPVLHSVPDEQAWLQVPQLLLSDCRSTHAVPQRVALGPHAAAPHIPPEQVWPVPHALPQAPQLLGSVLRAVQTELEPAVQTIWPVGHAPHVPPTQL